MARIRTIKPEFWTDDLMGSLSREARLLFIATWNMADDEGLLRWSAPYLKGAVFPFDDDIGVKHVEALMGKLEEAEIIFSYKGGRSQQSLGYIINFHKHQKINRPSPSRLPPPSLQDNGAREMYRKRDGNTCHLCRSPIDIVATECKFGGWIDDFCLSLDHVDPVSKGGSDAPSNIRASHQTCNKGRCNRTIEEYQALLASGATNAQKRFPERFTVWDLTGSVTISVSDSLLEQEREREPVKEKEKESLSAAAASRAARFDAFWKVCPKKVGKGIAKRSFAKAVKAVDPEILISAMARYAAAQAGKDPTYTAHPATWLNQERWTDEESASATGPPALRLVSDETQAQEQENLRKLGMI